MLLTFQLTDGTIMANAFGNLDWYRLTPDTNGSYLNGTWTKLASMSQTHLYASSQVLRDGRVYLGGAEFGTGSNSVEIYQPTNNTWTLMNPAAHYADPDAVVDLFGPSSTLTNGNLIVSTYYGPNATEIFNVTSNVWSAGPAPLSYQSGNTWVKLPDDSILTADIYTTDSERYIPALNQWVDDGSLPVDIYNYVDGGQTGGGFLLPNGKVVFFGGSSHVAIYTPTGTTNAGTWVAAADIPSGRSMMNAPSAMLVNGKILCATSPSTFVGGDTQYFEYDYTLNTWTPVNTPFGGTSLNSPALSQCMLPLPDGTILLSLSSSQLFIYQPDGSPLAAGKPVINNVTPNADGSFHVTGKLLNGISEGANFGDEFQNSSAYPIARITNAAGRVFYCRTYNFSSRSVMTGTNVMSTEMTLPPGLLPGTYPLVISANGNSSAAYSLSITGTPLPSVSGLAFTAIVSNKMTFNWNPLALTETGYVIQRSTNGTSFNTIGTVAANVSTYADSTAVPLTPYYYRVLGTNSLGLGNACPAILAGSPPVVALAAPWQSQDINASAYPGHGTAGQVAGVYTVIGSGGGLGGSSDQFQFASQPLIGDFTITARVTSETNTGVNALAGVMMRNGLDAGSADVLMAFGAGFSNSVFQSRSPDGSTAVSSNGPGALKVPLWVRLVRSGNTFTGFTSPNGTTFTQRGAAVVGMELAVYAGLAVTSSDTNFLNAATFDNVTVTGTVASVSPPTAHWKLDETSGTSALDSRSGLNGAYQNCLLGQPGATPETGTSVGFNGGDVLLPALGLSTNLVTITAWVNPNGVQSQYAGILYGGFASGLVFGTGNQKGYWWTGLQSGYNSGLVLPANQWTYVALVIEPTRARLYMITNGVITGATNNSPNTLDAFTGSSFLGSGPFGTTLLGNLDDVSWFAGQALTPAQISQLAATPNIAITNPVADSGFSAPATFRITASATGTNGHTFNAVQLFTNGVFVSQSAAPPFTNTLNNLPAGAYALSARLYYDSGLAVDSGIVNVFVQSATVTPQNVTATAVASNLVNVQWSSATNASGYIVSRSGTPVAGVSGTAFDDFGVSGGGNYCYTVVATNLISSSAASASSCVTTPTSGGALYWDANGSLAGPQDGDGTWSSNSVTWWNGAGTTAWVTNRIAVLGVNTTTNCTVTITRDERTAGVVFNSTRGGNYTLTGSQSLILPSNSVIRLDANAVINCPFTTLPASDSSFIKAGLGYLVISNSSPSYYGVVSVNSGILEMQSGPPLTQIGYIIGTNGILRHGYFAGYNFSQSIIVHGAGVNSTNGLYIARGTSLNHNAITLDTAPTTIRSYGGTNATAVWQALFGDWSTFAAASGSVIDPTVIIDSSGYGCTIYTESGANTASGDLVVNSRITGDSPLAKAGTGSLRLNAASFYTGPTDVQGGTFQADALLNATAVTVENGATLAGVGTLAIAPTLASGGTLAPGDNGIGTLTISAPLTLGAGSTTRMEINKTGTTLTNDVITVSGTLTYGGTLSVTNIGTGSLTLGNSFQIVQCRRLRLVVHHPDPALRGQHAPLGYFRSHHERHHRGCEWRSLLPGQS